MSRLVDLFNKKNKSVLNVYCTAGFPRLDSTIEVMIALEKNGVDLIELGIPYSDPLADGEIIQHSGSVALKNGMTIKTLFGQLKGFRNKISVPVVLMGYLNPVLQYGFEKFCSDAASLGIDGLILPDVPEISFENEYKAVIEKYGLNFIFLITPETSETRVKELDTLSSGFLYAVSSSSTTGREKNFSDVEKYLQRLQSYKLKNPVLTGFGVKDSSTFQSVCKYSNGAIIGSAYIRALQQQDDIARATESFLRTVLK